MGKQKLMGNDRARQLLAQEAARIIVEQGVRDYRAAKVKAAERLGLHARGALPGNAEIEVAVSEHLQLFGGESHSELLRAFREVALAAMEFLAEHSPRLVGPVLNGTADANSSVNLHVFADSPEIVALLLSDLGMAYRPYERRLRSQRNRKAGAEAYAGFQFRLKHTSIEATVFPVDGIRQAPISPIDGRPMRRADTQTVREMIAAD